MATEIKLPLPAEEVETVEVVSVKVSPGDVVSAGQALLEVEVEKSTVEVPAPMAGTVTEIRVKKGDQLSVGQTFCLIEAAEKKDNGQPKAADKPKPAAGAKTEKKEIAPQKATEKADRKDKAPAPKEVPVEVAVAPAAAAPAPFRPAAAPAPPPAKADGSSELILAGPATRQLARELGVDIAQVPGSGRGERISPDDVKGYVRRLVSSRQTSAGQEAPPLPDFAKWGPIDRQPFDGVRRVTTRQMSLSWSLIPHVTQHDQADITDLDAFRKKQDGRGPKLTVTAFALKAAALALKEFPQFNASIDTAAEEIILKRYYHIGVAVDTERGLLVPVLQDVDKKSVLELARELGEIAQQAREGKAQMRGGTFTISNLGGIGGTGFTPIVNYPEVAILGMSRAQLQGVVQAGQIVPRLILPLSLSYDHRIIDGAAAARFTRRLADMLSNPLEMLLLA